MTEPNEAMKAMARRIGKTVCEQNGLKLEYALAYEAALAAIMETQRLDAALVEELAPSAETATDAVVQAERDAEIAAAIRAGAHYALAGDRHANQR